MIVIGKVSLNPEAFKDYTKEQFFDEYKGKLDVDKEIVWIKIVAANRAQSESFEEVKAIFKPKDESVNSTGKQSKKHNGK